MAESQDTLHDTAQKTWRRRGLFAAAAAAVAGLVAKVTEQRVEAGTDGDVVLGAANTTTGITSITNTAPNGDALDLICLASTYGAGLFAVGGRFGVSAQNTTAAGGAGVFGYAPLADSAGVWGLNAGGIGVFGQSVSGIGIRGEIPSSSSNQTTAIYGVNSSSYTGSVPGTGGWGVVGVSHYGHGVLGATSANGAGAVVGSNSGVGGAYAGIFFGPAIVEGDFTVVGGAKSAAVPHPDGSHRRLYCVESPESWFEDFGEGKLECGGATVRLDPDFVAVAETTTYHVFLTGYDDQYELCAADRTPSGFHVRTRSGDGNGTFAWRVVAKRKDIASPRFEPVVLPPKPEMPTLPDAPAMPTPPVMRRHH